MSSSPSAAVDSPPTPQLGVSLDAAAGSNTHISTKSEDAPTITKDTAESSEPGKEEFSVETGNEDSKDETNERGENQSPDANKSLISKMSLQRQILTMLALALAVFIASLDQTIVASSMPTIAEHFNALSSVNWIATVFLLASTALQPLYGRLSDIFGRIETLIFGLIIFLIGSAVSGAATSIGMLIAARTIQGLGASSLISLVMVIVSDITIERERGKLSSVFSSVWAVSAVLGPVLGGVFTESKGGWRWVFYFSIPVGVVAGLFIVTFLRLPRPRGSFREKLARVDFLGIAVLVSGIVMVLLALSFGGKDYPWSSAVVLCLLIFGIVVVGIFVLIEWKIPAEPIMPLRLYKNRNVGLVLLMQLFLGAALFGPSFYIPLFFSVVRSSSPITSGLHLLPFMLPICVFAMIGGWTIAKTGRYRELMWLGGVITAVGLGLMALLDENSSNSKSIGLLIIAGVGVGLELQPGMLAVQTACEPRDMAAATTLLVSIRTLGGTVGLAIFQTVLQNSLKSKMAPIFHQFPEYAGIISASIDNQAAIHKGGIPADLQVALVRAYAGAMRYVFIAMIPFGAMMTIITLPTKHIPLRTRMAKAVSE
ncbi:hypothetical protein GQ54DRAFT_297237 [Martensiomyces pterosporus]|nr:hypothetical protein GQ54DRAFT_297237 [Martensiomyces pterosporus]